MNIYRVVVRPNIRYALAHAVELPLTKDMIEQAVAGAAVQELGHDQFGQRVVAVGLQLSLIHISEPTRHSLISYAVFCLKKFFF